jgi:hypothetical protein
MDVLFWFIPIVAIIGGITLAVVGTITHARLRELEVRERIAMIEKGLVPPPETNPRGFEQAMDAVDRLSQQSGSLAPGRHRRGRAPERHRNGGIILIGISLGLMLMLGVTTGEPEIGVGVGGFLLFLGIALLITSVLERRDRIRDAWTDSWPVPPPPLPRSPTGESQAPRS